MELAEAIVMALFGLVITLTAILTHATWEIIAPGATLLIIGIYLIVRLLIEKKKEEEQLPVEPKKVH